MGPYIRVLGLGLGLSGPNAGTQYQQHGKSHERIKMAMKKKCCQHGCKRNLTWKMVTSLCLAFWSLAKSGQDGLFLVLKI